MKKIKLNKKSLTKNPYRVPEDYFSQVKIQISEIPVHHPLPKVVWYRRPVVWQWSAAASLVIIMSLSLVFHATGREETKELASEDVMALYEHGWEEVDDQLLLESYSAQEWEDLTNSFYVETAPELDEYWDDELETHDFDPAIDL
jgi:hypothetical protein